MISEKVYNIDVLNRIVTSKAQYYAMLSQEFILPDIHSHACSMEYLLKYSEDPMRIYTCPVEGTKIFEPRFRRKNAVELLEALEELLAKKGKPPTGMTPLKLPDTNWLCLVLHREDPNDTLNIFQKKSGNLILTRTVNEKYFFMISFLFIEYIRINKLLKLEEPGSKKRALFRKTITEKDALKKANLEKTLIRKQKQRRVFNTFFDKLDEDIQKLSHKLQPQEVEIDENVDEEEKEMENDKIDIVNDLNFENPELLKKVDEE